MSDMQIQAVLSQMRALASRAGVDAPAAGTGAAAGIEQRTATQRAQGADFATLLQRSLEEVNAAQNEANHLATQFVAGSTEVGLPEVMIASQKASLQFEAVTQVRNRLVAAYQEIMNMPL